MFTFIIFYYLKNVELSGFLKNMLLLRTGGGVGAYMYTRLPTQATKAPHHFSDSVGVISETGFLFVFLCINYLKVLIIKADLRKIVIKLTV
jgi:hypothetical protein